MIRIIGVLVLALGLLSCTGPGAGTTASAGTTYTVGGQAVAGPTCPVEPASPAPGQCAPRPVPGAALVITDRAGHEVARLTTDARGAFSTQLPAGSYILVPQPVQGLMGTAPAVPLTVSASEHPTGLRVTYDTGIR